MKKKAKGTSTSVLAEDIFRKKGGDSSNNNKDTTIPIKPTEKEFAEAHTPGLSPDTFQIADKTFQLRMSNIKTQKIMVHALDAITDLIKKIDLLPIFKSIQDKLNRNQDVLMAKIKGSVNSKEDIDLADDSNEYLDMVELIRDVVAHGGLGNIMGTILDIYIGVVYAVCNSQNKDIDRDWIEENISFYDAQRIFFMQMEKDRIGGRVINFLHILTRQIVNETT